MKLIAAFTVAHIVATAAIIYTDPFYNKIPYYRSALSGVDCMNFSMATQNVSAMS